MEPEDFTRQALYSVLDLGFLFASFKAMNTKFNNFISFDEVKFGLWQNDIGNVSEVSQFAFFSVL